LSSTKASPIEVKGRRTVTEAGVGVRGRDASEGKVSFGFADDEGGKYLGKVTMTAAATMQLPNTIAASSIHTPWAQPEFFAIPITEILKVKLSLALYPWEKARERPNCVEAPTN
jgi:hypothetical protein